MNHYASPALWKRRKALPEPIQRAADKSFALLQENPAHPSLHFKRVGVYWPARVNLDTECSVFPLKTAFCGSGSATTENMIGC